VEKGAVEFILRDFVVLCRKLIAGEFPNPLLNADDEARQVLVALDVAECGLRAQVRQLGA